MARTSSRLSRYSETLAWMRAQASSVELRKTQGWHLWEPTRGSGFVGPRAVPLSPRERELDFLCSCIQESRDVPDLNEETRIDLCTRLSKSGRMDGRAMSLLVSGQRLSQLVIPDCSKISASHFCAAFGRMSTAALRVIQLGRCGRVLSEEFVSCVRREREFPMFQKLSLSQANGLTDEILVELVAAFEKFTCFEVESCDTITEFGINTALQIVGMHLECLSLRGCGQLILKNLLVSSITMPRLNRLTLSRISEVADNVLQVVLEFSGQNLTELYLSECKALTDVAVNVIVTRCPGLKVLNLSGLSRLTDASIETMVNHEVRYEKLYLDNGEFSDDALACLISCLQGNLKFLSLQEVTQVGDNTLYALATHCQDSLEELRLSFAQKLSDEYLGFLADSCRRLTKLTLHACRQVTDIFRNGHSNSQLHVEP